jgi:putative ABC transport system permease protein
MKRFTGFWGAISAWFGGVSRRPARVLLTVLGIAAGVTLSFAASAQNASLSSGTAQLYHQLAGRSSLELVALGPQGMPLAVAERVRGLAGVRAAAPVSESWITLRHGSRSVDLRLLGLDQSIGAIAGTLGRNMPHIKRGGTIGLYLPKRIASRLGVGGEAEVQAVSQIGLTPTYVAGVLSARRLGSLAESSVALAPLALAELLSGGGDHIQRVLVAVQGNQPGMRQALQAAGGPGTVVSSATQEVQTAEQASALDRSSSSLFAALSLVVGGLLAYGAMMLTMAERRREVAMLRALGCGLGALLSAVLLDALLLGLLGTALGLLCGRLAVGWLLPSSNSFLASAFLLSSKVVVPLGIVLLSCVAGVLTALAAALLPARALARVAPAEALHADTGISVGGGRVPTRLLLVLVAVAGGAGIVASGAGWGMIGVPLWVGAGLLAVPVVVGAVARAARRLTPTPGAAMSVGVAEIAAFPARAIAATAVVCLAVSGLVIVNGAVANLEGGTAQLTASSYPAGNLFVTAAGREEIFFTQPLASSFAARLQHLPFVAEVKPWRSAFLDWGTRRVLAYAFTEGAPRPFRTGELIKGSARTAATALAEDGRAVALSSDLAAADGLHIGSRLALPTPRGPREVHVVALITNYGWVPGAIALNAASFASWWGGQNVTALQIELRAGTSRAVAMRRVQAALAGSGLSTVTSAQLRSRAAASARSQLANLKRIGELIALAGLLAVTAVVLAGVLLRIRRVSALRTIGMSLPQMAVALATESGLIVVSGTVLGMLVGVVGQALVIHYLSDSFAMAVSFQLLPSQLLAVVVLAGAIVLSATLLALHRAARAPLAASLMET